MDTGHYIFTVHKNLDAARSAQSRMKDGAVFGAVNLCAGKHRFDFSAQFNRFGQFNQPLHGVFRDAVFGIVEKQIAGSQRKGFGAVRVGGEQLTQVFRFDLFKMVRKGFPFGAFIKLGHIFSPI